MDCEKQADAYWCKVPSIGEYNVQSYVCDPADGVLADDDAEGQRIVKGYALSGGGRGIQRVGKNWKKLT